MSSAYERECVNALHAAGFGVMRAPSSGSATGRDLPDVIVGRPVKAFTNPLQRQDELPAPATYSELWLIEHKSGKAATLYVTEQEVEDLLAIAVRFGATPLLGGRSTRRSTPTDHFLLRPDDARHTPKGNFGIPFVDEEELRARAYMVISAKGVIRKPPCEPVISHHNPSRPGSA